MNPSSQDELARRLTDTSHREDREDTWVGGSFGGEVHTRLLPDLGAPGEVLVGDEERIRTLQALRDSLRIEAERERAAAQHAAVEVAEWREKAHEMWVAAEERAGQVRVLEEALEGARAQVVLAEAEGAQARGEAEKAHEMWVAAEERAGQVRVLEEALEGARAQVVLAEAEGAQARGEVICVKDSGQSLGLIPSCSQAAAAALR